MIKTPEDRPQVNDNLPAEAAGFRRLNRIGLNRIFNRNFIRDMDEMEWNVSISSTGWTEIHWIHCQRRLRLSTLSFTEFITTITSILVLRFHGLLCPVNFILNRTVRLTVSQYFYSNRGSHHMRHTVFPIRDLNTSFRVRGNLVISNGDISLGDIIFSDGDLN